MNIKTFGPVNQRSLEQLQRCMAAGDAEFGVLCADHHPGYSQPIGGGIAYEGFISPSGVGYDIGCIGAGARVTLDDGCSVAIEEFDGSSPPRCWDSRELRSVAGRTMLAARGRRATVRLVLENGRSLLATHDHLVRTKLGWREVSLLREGDSVACSPFVGLCRARTDVSELNIEPPAEPGGRRVTSRRRELEKRGLWPVSTVDPRLPALLRLLGYVSGDGHLARDGKSLSAYAFCDEDARALRRDFVTMGFQPRLYVRKKAAHLKPEICVRVSSVALAWLFTALGSPVGKKAWSRDPMPWLLNLPAWLRAQFVSGFASADMSSPRLVDGRISNITAKQVGENDHAAAFLVDVLGSLGFRTGTTSRAEGIGRRAYAIQILGGEDEQLRFLAEVGYCFSHQERIVSAAAASVAWQRSAVLNRRHAAVVEARALRSSGVSHRNAVGSVAARFDVPRALVHHGLYGRTGFRSPKGFRPEPDSSGEIAWATVAAVEPGHASEVFDVVTSDLAESFLAEGIVVHNCGNKAARTELKRADLDERGGVEPLMREITRRISFGMGMAAQERIDHPVLDRISNAEFAPQRKLAQSARAQLGTVGSGNHYVNLMEDEEGHVWVGVHFGSRGFGHKTASGFLALAQGLPFEGRASEGEMDSPPVLFEVGSELGESYIAAMQLAGEYAYAGRDVVVSKVLEILGTEPVHEVHNHHNFAWHEEHFGRTYWVIRKGCTPARPGQEGFVGASMGGESVILEGAESPDAEESLYSTVHGAGRVMSRTQAAGRVRRRKRWACRNRDCDRVFDRNTPCPDHPDAGVHKVRVEELLKAGVVDWPAVQARLREQGIVLVGGGADEAPEVYKRLPEVLAAHGDTIRVKHTLRPLGVAMARRDVHDPYKD